MASMAKNSAVNTQ